LIESLPQDDAVTPPLSPRASLAVCLLLLTLVSLSATDRGRSLPSSVEARAAAMAKTVTIYRDAYGVPHVYAPTDAACIFGFIYAQAEDYFWQIEDSYIRSLGRAAEVYGEKSLPDDLLNRALEIDRLAREEYERCSPQYKEFSQALADGLNYYLATHPQVKPRLINRFEPWHPFALRRFLLYQLFIYRGSGITVPEILSAVHEVKDGQKVGFNSSMYEDLLASVSLDNMSDHIGSNMWAVAPSKSETGKALLFINPHQPFFGPGQWYEGHLISGEGWNLSGACFFGSPFPTIGYNGHLAWSHTVNQPDIVDTYTIKFDDPQHPLRYRYGTETRDAVAWTDAVKVKSDQGTIQRQFRFTKTHHGPIVAVRDKKPLAVRLAKLEGSGTLEEWYSMGKAKTVAEFKAAMKACNIPMFNTLVADNAGNIFYVYNGSIPKRSTKFDWSKPVDGSNPETEWQGYHSFDELPQIKNPKCGFLQNCNQQPLTTTPLGTELKPGEGDENPKASQFPPYFFREKDRDNARARISRRILRSSEKFSFDQWTKAGFNTKVLEAEKQIPDLVKEWQALAASDAARADKLKDVIELFKSWNCTSTVDCVPMTIFVLTFDKVLKMVNNKDIFNFPRIRALEATVTELEKSYGTWKVAWGEINRLQRIHGSQVDMLGKGAFRDDQASLPVAGSPGPVGIVFNFYALPQTGQKRRYGVGGHSFVGVVELTERPRAKTILQFGQSGDPSSPHWFDQALLYAKGEFKTSWFEKSAVESNCERHYHPGDVTTAGK
jgi:penicillin amidase